MERTTLSPEYRERMLERFKKYAAINTASYDKIPKGTCPTTKHQFYLAVRLDLELHAIGVSNVYIGTDCYVYGTIPENLPPNHPAKGKIPSLGLLAHLDTSQSQSGENVKPRVIRDYQGQDITFPDDPGLVLKVLENPELLRCKGFTIVTAGGKTLLGADDKAGIAEIMTIAEYLLRENIPHGEIHICFNPDEEVARGTDHIDLKKFRVKYAFTLDGSKEGEIEDECFNASTAKVVITGIDIHPGYAKNRLVNALRVAAWLIENLPEKYFPENSENREPYLFPCECPSTPTVEKFELNFLLRAFTESDLQRMELVLRDLCTQTEYEFPGSKVTVKVEKSYKNMKSVIDLHPLVMELLERACRV